MKLSVVIPVYIEPATLPLLLERVLASNTILPTTSP
jgi:glycosyltransferase involved in cell wall biosynthesis